MATPNGAPLPINTALLTNGNYLKLEIQNNVELRPATDFSEAFYGRGARLVETISDGTIIWTGPWVYSSNSVIDDDVYLSELADRITALNQADPSILIVEMGKSNEEAAVEYWIYNGQIFTSENPDKGYNKVTISVEFYNKPSSVVVPNSDGFFTINYNIAPNGDYIWDEIQSEIKSITIESPEEKYQPITLKNFVPTIKEGYTTRSGEASNFASILFYDLGKIVLTPPFQTQSKTLQDIEIIDKTAPIKSVRELPKPQRATPDAQASKRVRKFVFSLAKRLPKYVLTLLAPFGAHLVKAALDSKRGQELTKLATSCPNPEQLLIIISLRNQLVTIINNAYKVISTTNDVIVITQTVLGAINAILVLLKNLPYPSTGVPFLGLPPITAGQINQFSLTVTNIQTKLKNGQIGLSVVQSLLAILEGLLLQILEILKSLDTLIQNCAEEQNMPYELIRVELVTTQGQYETSYKGFNFAIKQENLNNPTYPKRYAIAVNQQGLTVLRTSSSFTSEPQILIDELKFIIDRDNLKPY